MSRYTDTLRRFYSTQSLKLSQSPCRVLIRNDALTKEVQLETSQKSCPCCSSHCGLKVFVYMVMNEACHIPNEDIPKATGAVVMKHSKMIRPPPMEVVLNFISLNFIKAYASRCRAAFSFLFRSAHINHDTQRVRTGCCRGHK